MIRRSWRKRRMEEQGRRVEEQTRREEEQVRREDSGRSWEDMWEQGREWSGGKNF